MVVYDALERVPKIIFNEKDMVGLGRFTGKNGSIGSAEFARGLKTLCRYKILCGHMDVTQTDAIATAAVRDAHNGRDFVKAAEEETGFKIRILTGTEEGNYSGLGVLSGEPRATGIVGDLGGGSLELTDVSNGIAKKSISLPIGPLRLLTQFGENRTEIKKYLSSIYETISYLNSSEKKIFYPVGGAWRNICWLYLIQNNKPMSALHGYEIDIASLRQYLEYISNLSPGDPVLLEAVTQRRREILPLAAFIFLGVLDVMKPSSCIFSSYGLREGLIFSKLNSSDQQLDPFLCQCKTYAKERSRFPEHVEHLYKWTRVLFSNGETEASSGYISELSGNERLHMGVCLLSDIAWRTHQAYQTVKAMNVILYGQFVGISHNERLFVATALFYAYGGKNKTGLGIDIDKYLSDTLRQEARTLGVALQLAQRLSGGVDQVLNVAHLQKREGCLQLLLTENAQALVSKQVEKRLVQLASLINLKSRIIYL